MDQEFTSEKEYSPERAVTPPYLSRVRRWLEVIGEVLVMMPYLVGGGTKDFALVTSPEQIDQLVNPTAVVSDLHQGRSH